MEGVVLDFSLNTRTGLARCTQGNRYEFSIDEWKSSDLPKAGDRIDFQCIGDQAHEVYRTHTSNNSPYQAPNQPLAAGQAPVTNALAVISMIAGILGLFFFGSLIAVICGHISRSQIRNSNGRESGDGMALAGLITGYIGLVLGLIFLLVWIVAFAFAASSGY